MSYKIMVVYDASSLIYIALVVGFQYIYEITQIDKWPAQA